MKMLTLDDLVRFCKDSNLRTFNARESGQPIVVSVPAVFSEDDNNKSSSILFVLIKMMHVGKNRNGSNLTEDAAKNCLSTIAYKPILANFCEIDGVKDFTSHDFVVKTDENGNEYVEYFERQIGSFTSEDPYIEYDAVEGKNYVYARAAIPREYTDAAEIIERKKGTKVSVELQINKMSYNAVDSVLNLEDVEVMGCTCLGVNPETGVEVQEGMKGANLKIEDFNQQNNSVQFERDEKLIDVLEKLNDTLSNFNNNSVRKEEFAAMNENVQTENENVTEQETVEAEVTTTTEEAGTAAFEGDGETQEAGAGTGTVEGSGAALDDNEPDEPITTPEGTVETVVNTDDEAAVAPTKKEKKVEYSVTVAEGDCRTFSISLEDMDFALWKLVDETYGVPEDVYYSVIVYPDDNYLIMSSYRNGDYKQSYAKDEDDNFSLTGDRIEVFRQWVTADERKALELMRKTYAEMESKLQAYELKEENEKKNALMNSDDYSAIFDTDEYKTLKASDSKATFDSMTSDDLEKKLDSILLTYSKAHKLTNDDVQTSVNKKTIPTVVVKKTGRYGKLFD